MGIRISFAAFLPHPEIRNCRTRRKSFKIRHARVAELADALDLGLRGQLLSLAIREAGACILLTEQEI